MSLYSEFQETYFDDNLHISIKLGNAICESNSAELDDLIDKYFSTPETAKLLEGPIAYRSADQGGGDDGQLLPPAYLSFLRSNRKALARIINTTGTPDARIHPDSGYTLLMFAAEKGDTETVKLLLSLGADPNNCLEIADGVCLTPLFRAVVGGYKKTSELLISHGARFSITEALAAIEADAKFPPFIEELIKNDLSLLRQRGFEDQRTLLHHACGHEKISIVKWLIDHGAEIDAADKNNYTPLFYAKSLKNDSIADYLISNGADPSCSTSGEEIKQRTELEIAEGQLEDAKSNQNKLRTELEKVEGQLDEAKPKDITSIIERLELIEEKLGVRFEGIYGVQVKRGWENPVDFLVEVNFDVIGTEDTLKRSFKPTLSAYNSAGQLLNTNTSFINNDRFIGIESIKIQLLCAEAPARLRLYPANPM